jgi:hypothetical protein
MANRKRLGRDLTKLGRLGRNLSKLGRLDRDLSKLGRLDRNLPKLVLGSVHMSGMGKVERIRHCKVVTNPRVLHGTAEEGVLLHEEDGVRQLILLFYHTAEAQQYSCLNIASPGVRCLEITDEVPACGDDGEVHTVTGDPDVDGSQEHGLTG